MSHPEPKRLKQDKLIMSVCYKCGHLHESHQEPEKCSKCGKAFLPLNYFDKVHAAKVEKYQDLFAESDELNEEDLIKGLYVLW